jgi:hypothetical protein
MAHFLASDARYRDLQFSFAASLVASHLCRAVGSLVTFLSLCWDGPVRKYHPEDHYMRGPGPKWREKQLLNRNPT